MKDNMKEKDLTVDFFFGNEEINPFNAPQMCVVRRLSNAYHELENEKFPANKAEINLRIAKLSFYEELIDICIRCLCPKCLSEYIDNPNYIVRRLDPFAKEKDRCDKCDKAGWDYVVTERSSVRKGKSGSYEK